MSLNPARAAFVQQPYRIAVHVDHAVRSKYPAAREIEHLTNTSEAVANAIAAAMLLDAKMAKSGIQLTIDQAISTDQFANMALRFEVTLPKLEVYDRVCRVVSYSVDWTVGRTVLVLK